MNTTNDMTEQDKGGVEREPDGIRFCRICAENPDMNGFNMYQEDAVELLADYDAMKAKVAMRASILGWPQEADDIMDAIRTHAVKAGMQIGEDESYAQCDIIKAYAEKLITLLQQSTQQRIAELERELATARTDHINEMAASAELRTAIAELAEERSGGVHCNDCGSYDIRPDAPTQQEATNGAQGDRETAERERDELKLLNTAGSKENREQQQRIAELERELAELRPLDEMCRPFYDNLAGEEGCSPYVEWVGKHLNFAHYVIAGTIGIDAGHGIREDKWLNWATEIGRTYYDKKATEATNGD